jgi:hypothetical protein
MTRIQILKNSLRFRTDSTPKSFQNAIIRYLYLICPLKICNKYLLFLNQSDNNFGISIEYFGLIV